jgi:hypothetical protein
MLQIRHLNYIYFYSDQNTWYLYPFYSLFVLLSVSYKGKFEQTGNISQTFTEQHSYEFLREMSWTL